MPASSSLIYSQLSPSSKQPQPQPQQHATIEEADIFNTKYTAHHDSPLSSSHFKRPSIKWRSMLAHLSPPRLLSTSPFRSTKPCNSPHTQLLPSASSALPCDFPSAFSPSHDTTCESFVLPHLPPTAAATEMPVPNTNNNPLTLCNSFPLNYTEAANDVEQLLHIFLEASRLNGIKVQTRTLSALCTVCANSPGTTDRFVAAGGIEIILKILNRTAQLQHASPPTTTIVEETEKALLLLQLSTSYSKDGCTAALQQCDSIISALGKKLLRVSETCTSSTIDVLTALCRRSESSSRRSESSTALFRKAILETAIPSKLVVVLQVASKGSTKRRAGVLLRILLGEEEEQQQITREAQF